MIARFIHRLFHYHCEECLQEEREKNYCSSCETLKQQLSLAHQENQRLLSLAIRQNEPVKEVIDDTPREIPQKLPHVVPWSVKKQMLEQESREKAAALKQQREMYGSPKSSVEELEKELGVENAS